MPMKPDFTIRRIRPEEASLLWDFLYLAIFVPEGTEPPGREILDLPELRVYAEGFGSLPGDLGMFAEAADGKVLGAAWVRRIRTYGWVDDGTPILSVSLLPEARGMGIGTGLLTELFDQCRSAGIRRLSLSVQKANRAERLYRRLGFLPVKEEDGEYTMAMTL